MPRRSKRCRSLTASGLTPRERMSWQLLIGADQIEAYADRLMASHDEQRRCGWGYETGGRGLGMVLCSILFAMASYSNAIWRKDAMSFLSVRPEARRRHFAASSRKWATSAETSFIPNS